MMNLFPRPTASPLSCPSSSVVEEATVEIRIDQALETTPLLSTVDQMSEVGMRLNGNISTPPVIAQTQMLCHPGVPRLNAEELCPRGLSAEEKIRFWNAYENAGTPFKAGLLVLVTTGLGLMVGTWGVAAVNLITGQVSEHRDHMPLDWGVALAGGAIVGMVYGCVKVRRSDDELVRLSRPPEQTGPF